MSSLSETDSGVGTDTISPVAWRSVVSIPEDVPSTYSLPFEITRYIFKYYRHNLPLLNPNVCPRDINLEYHLGVNKFGAVCKQWRDASIEGESYSLDWAESARKLISILRGRTRSATNLRRLAWYNLGPEEAPLCELLRISRKSLVTAHFLIEAFRFDDEEGVLKPCSCLLFKEIGQAVNLSRLHLHFRGINGACRVEANYFEQKEMYKMITACKSLRHFSLDNCFSNPEERFDRKTFLSSAAKPWHTITHLTVSASDRSIALTTDLLSAGTITHFTLRQASTFWRADPSDRSLFKLQAELRTHAHQLIELKFPYSVDYLDEFDREETYTFLEPIIPLLASCERLVLLNNHVKTLSSLHLPHLPKIQHITVMGMTFTDDSEDLEQLVQFSTQHVDTIKTLRTTPYRDDHSRTKYSNLNAETRQKILDLYSWSIENSIQIKLDDFKDGGIGVHILPRDEDMYLGESEHGSVNFDKYYFDAYQYESSKRLNTGRYPYDIL